MTANRVISIFTILILWIVFGIPVKGEEKCFRVINASNGLWDNNVQQVFQLNDDRMVVATVGNVNIFDGSSFSYIHQPYSARFPLSAYKGYFHIYLDDDDFLWIKDTHQLRCIDLRTECYVTDVGAVLRHFGIHVRLINDFFVDSDRRIWILSGNRLVCEKNSLSIILPDQYGDIQDVDVMKGRLYVFCSKGYVVCFNLSNGKMLYSIPAYNQADQKNFVLTSLVLRSNNGIFYQLRFGKDKHSVLLAFDTTRRTWQRLLETPYFLRSMDMTADRVIYIVSENGYWSYDTKSGAQSLYSQISLNNGTKSAFNLNSICVDKHGGLWLASNSHGLLYSKPHQSPFHKYSLDDPRMEKLNRIVASRKNKNNTYRSSMRNVVYRDSRGWIWEGTFDGLILSPDRNLNHRRSFYSENGLSNNVIRSVVEDRRHNIWVSTSFGINHINVDERTHTFTITSYQNDEGISKEEYNNDASVLLADGTIGMQGVEGWTLFNPENFTTLYINAHKNDNLLYTPLLTKLYVRGINIVKDSLYDDRLILKKSLAFTDSLVLEHHQNVLSFAFSAMNYFRPTQTYYRYRLLGSEDNSWHVISYNSSNGLVDRGGVAHLPFSNLRPGDYRLEVMASMSPKFWNGGVRTIFIRILEPWWSSNAIYFVFGILLIGLLISEIRTYSNMIKLRAERVDKDALLLFRLREFISKCSESEKNNFLIKSIDYTFISPELELTADEVNFVERVLSIKDAVGSKMSIDKLARGLNLDRNDLYDLILSVIYKTPKMYVLTYRTRRIAEHIRHGEENLDAMAYASGFCEVEFMRSTFEKVYGCSIEEFSSKCH